MITSAIIDTNNQQKFLTKFSQIIFGKSRESLDQFDKSIKSYIKKFEVGGLLGPPPAQVGLRLLKSSKFRPFNWQKIA